MINRNKIINAAVPVFAQKGRHGARMEDIASYGRINKAMIYYIYHSKDELYFEVIKHVFEKLIESFITVADSQVQNDGDYFWNSSEDISSRVSFFTGNRDYMKIFIDTLSNGTDESVRAFRYIKETYKDKNITDLMKKLLVKVESGRIPGENNTDKIMACIFVMLITDYLPGYLLELWS